MPDFDWKRHLRFVVDEVDRIGDPIERLRYLTQVRLHLADVLTECYERACWDARYIERDRSAMKAGGLSKHAFEGYARRWNGRLSREQRVYWADPIRPHSRKKILDLTEVAYGNSPTSIDTGFRKSDPEGTENG